MTGSHERLPVDRASPSAITGSAPSIDPPPTAGTSATEVPSPVPTVAPSTAPTTEPSAEPTAVLTFEQPGVKTGLPSQSGRFGTATPIARVGQYISWRAVVGPGGSGQAIDVEVATRLDDDWTGWSKLTSRDADAEGIVVFTWRQQTPAWISVRFALPSSHSIALQGRWR